MSFNYFPLSKYTNEQCLVGFNIYATEEDSIHTIFCLFIPFGFIIDIITLIPRLIYHKCKYENYNNVNNDKQIYYDYYYAYEDDKTSINYYDINDNEYFL